MKEPGLRIWLTRSGKRANWVIRYQYPESSRIYQQSTGTTSKKDAERLLGQLRADLVNRRHQPQSSILWSEYRLRYEQDVVTGLASKTGLKIDTIFDAIERILKPVKLRDLTSERLSYFQGMLREEGRAETTIAGYLAHLRSALKWAVDVGLLPVLPKIQKPKRAKTSKVMKGRPVTAAEFDEMLKSVPTVVGEEAAASWRHYLTGLWWSGLRLGESLDLFWNDDSMLCVTFVGEEPMLRIPAELEKGNKDRLLPIAPEFRDFLLSTPFPARSGRVFKLQARKERGERLTADRVTRIVSAIGRKANVVVDSHRNKYATAHDLRRSFGERWAARVMPQVLMELMRHESIDTTLKYYVGRNAERTTMLLREAYNKVRDSSD